MNTLLRSFVSAFVLAAILPAAALANDAKKPTFEAALKDQAPKIVEFLWAKMDHPQDALNVGALKFLVQIGNAPPSDNAGALNLYTARRLEAALILCLDDKSKVRILHNPSAQIKNGSVNHRTPRGRKAFFAEGARRYRPAWGAGEGIPAHVFLTGVVKIEEAGRTAEVVVSAFDRSGKSPEEVCRFQAATDPRLLAEAGLSGVISHGSDPNDWAVALANPKPSTPAPEEKAPTPSELLQKAPVEVQIFYNGEEQKVADDGSIPEPASKDTVTFRLRHKNNDNKTYGVILKVNGQNTLLPDDPDAEDLFRCYKWIVKPRSQFEIKGYQLSLTEKAKAFRVLSRAQSRKNAIYYGEHAGTFTIVFLEGKDADEKPRIVQSLPEDMVAIGRGVPNRLGEFGSLAALQAHLKGANRPGSQREVAKGLIQQGADTEQVVEEVPFRASEKRIPVIQIRYYKPSSEN